MGRGVWVGCVAVAAMASAACSTRDRAASPTSPVDSTSAALAGQLTVPSGFQVTYFARNRRINLYSVLPLCVDQVRRFYNQPDLIVLFEILNRRERLENSSFVNRFNCDVHEFVPQSHILSRTATT